jgi:hypothetical protein
MNNTFTNVLLVIVLLLLVGFGVWYFTAREAPPEDGASIELNLGGEERGEGN